MKLIPTIGYVIVEKFQKIDVKNGIYMPAPFEAPKNRSRGRVLAINVEEEDKPKLTYGVGDVVIVTEVEPIQMIEGEDDRFYMICRWFQVVCTLNGTVEEMMKLQGIDPESKKVIV